MKSAIGEGMTRDDHADVSNQLVSLVSSAISLELSIRCRFWFKKQNSPLRFILIADMTLDKLVTAVCQSSCYELL